MGRELAKHFSLPLSSAPFPFYIVKSARPSTFTSNPFIISSSPTSHIATAAPPPRRRRQQPVMKTHNKFHHRSPSRKSPRLSSSSSSSTQPKCTPETRSDANANAWALSLYVEEQQPLNICYTSDEEDNSVRRSPRFTANKFKTPIQDGKIISRPKALPPALLTSQLRRSPRFCSSPSSAPPLTLRDCDKKRCRFEEEEALGRVVKKGKLGLVDKGVRRSPRLNRGVIGNSDLQLLALPEPGSGALSKGNLSERCLSSRTVGCEKGKMEKNGGNLSVNERCLRSRRISLDLVEAPESKAVRSASGELHSVGGSAFSEKCLRLRTVRMSVGNEEKSASKKRDCSFDYALIEWTEASEKRNLGSGLRRSPRLNEDSKLEIVALPEKNDFSMEKCLRSKKVKTQKETVKRSGSRVMSNEKYLMTPNSEPALGDLASEKREMKEFGSESMSEKCLRSRKIQFKVNVDESDEGESNGSNAKNSVDSEKKEKKVVCCFVGEPVPEEAARERWQWRYDLKSKRKGKSWKINADEEDEIILNVHCHYAQAKVGNCILDIGDCVYVKGEGNKKHIGRILEFFKTMEGEDYFRVQWFFRAEDTVLKDAASLHDKRRLFYSTLMNDNILDCIVSKVNVVKIPPVLCLKSNPIQSAAFYCNMEYCVEYSTFRTLVTETFTGSKSFLLNSNHRNEEPISLTPLEVLPNYESLKPELALLDLYAGCGGMSTGLCIGAKLSNFNLLTKWAVDHNSSACDSLKVNHPETQVRNEAAEDFLELLRQWERLCKLYVCDLERTLKCELESLCEDEGHTAEVASGEYEVFCLLDICYGDPSERGKRDLHFKVRWKGYGQEEDTWEPIEGLGNCEERIRDFVRNGFKRKILPLPGDADVICGGPPCQGISGYNRYRNFDSPLTDERNRQIVVFFDIVEFLKPKYVLMENVVDIIRFDKASLGRYALSRLVHMKYQARLGTIASGCYGLPQFRLRVFIWGAHPSETLPQFPLPTHDVVVRYWPPLEFERNIVAYDEGQPRTLEDAIVLRDSISDLPEVTNNETREEMAYEKLPETEFQSYIRLSKDEMMGSTSKPSEKRNSILYDHRPLQLSEHDYLRVCLIPRRKGANFRDFPGVVVGEDNVARRDPTKEPIMLPTGRPLVPECVLNFEQGKSKKPYARLWWDETVSTIVTLPYIRSQPVLHPEQDRLLTIREYARLQGFPDHYRFCGTIKERYCQIGNAVSIPVARALGYALGMAYQKLIGDEPLMILPPKFSSQLPLIDQMVVLRR